MSKAIDRANKDSTDWKIEVNIVIDGWVRGGYWQINEVKGNRKFIAHSEEDAIWLQRVLEIEGAVK